MYVFLFLLPFVPVASWHCLLLHRQTSHLGWSLMYWAWFLLAVLLEPFAAAFIIYSIGHLIPPHVNPELRLINDVLQHWIPFVPNAFYYFCNPLVAAAILFTLFVMCKNAEFRHRGLFTLGSAVLLRDLTTTLTQLPMSQFDIAPGDCVAYSTLPYLQIFAQHTVTGFACADYNYSGHTIFFTVGLIAMMLSIADGTLHLGVAAAAICRWLSVLTYATCLLCLVASRAHYSIDVLESGFITGTFYFFISPKVVRFFDQLAARSDL